MSSSLLFSGTKSPSTAANTMALLAKVLKGDEFRVPFDDIPKDEWYRNPSNDSCELISPVSVSEDNLLTEHTIGKKEVEKWVIDNIVDPK